MPRLSLVQHLALPDALPEDWRWRRVQSDINAAFAFKLTRMLAIQTPAFVLVLSRVATFGAQFSSRQGKHYPFTDHFPIRTPVHSFAIPHLT